MSAQHAGRSIRAHPYRIVPIGKETYGSLNSFLKGRENMEKTENKKLLSRTDLFSMAVGQIIGVGIMTMTGIAIGFTGRSVNIAYIVAGLITIIAVIPQIYIGGTANFRGGQYSQIAVLSGQRMAGIYLYVQLFSCLAISMYTLSFADYFLSLFPGVNAKLIVQLFDIFVWHAYFRCETGSKIQNILCAVLAIAIASYICLGIGHVQADYLTAGFMTKGVGGLFWHLFILHLQPAELSM